MPAAGNSRSMGIRMRATSWSASAPPANHLSAEDPVQRQVLKELAMSILSLNQPGVRRE
jgi:hypothetical protein